jgi:hypothetical protein
MSAQGLDCFLAAGAVDFFRISSGGLTIEKAAVSKHLRDAAFR